MPVSNTPGNKVLAATIVLLCILCSHTICLAQQRVRGIVLGPDKQPVENASILIKGTTLGTYSQADGRFSLQANPNTVLLISSVGFASKELTVSTDSVLIVILPFATNTLEDVVLLGYGSSRKEDITGAISKLSSNDFRNAVVTNPLQQIQGKVAGVVITQPGGDPNGDFIARVRGATSLEGQPPLLVIDGIAIDDFYTSLTTLNPADVETYTILKDASATAIYGARGANGVILVTTKKARPGKTVVAYHGLVGIEKIGHVIDVLNSDEWRKATASMNAGALDEGVDVNWQKEIARTAVLQSHTISISGAGKAIRYRGAAGYNKQEGIIYNTGRETVTARLAADQQNASGKLNTGMSINMALINRDMLADQNATNQVRTGGAFVFGITPGYLPVSPAYDTDGSFHQSPANAINPMMIIKGLYSKKKESFVQGSFKADYELLKGLKIGTLGALTIANDNYDRFWFFLPDATKTENKKQAFSGDLHINYNKKIGKHAVDITGVYEYNQFINEGFGITARGFLFSDLLTNNLGGATNVTTDDIYSFKNEVKLISFLGRVVYAYNNRYIVTANFRRDGSSKFGPNNRWGNFPSIALAWNLGNEKFLGKPAWLSALKLRASYGYTGNQENLSAYPYQLLYGRTGPFLNYGQFFQSYSITQEHNPDLKWEVRRSFNIGLDLSLVDNRVGATVDFFSDKTSDMLFLYDIPQPPFSIDKIYANAATGINQGLELTFNASPLQHKNISWDIQGNLSTLKNRITQLLGEFNGAELALNDRNYGYTQGGASGSTPITKLAIGYPVGIFWLPQHAGLNAAGQELFNNYDADGKLVGTSTSFTDKDRIYIDPTPQFTWGITNIVRVGKLDASFFIRGVQGQKVFANSILNLGTVAYLPGRNITKKALSNGFTQLPEASTYWLRDASYARLDNITIAYHFNQLKKIAALKIYVVASNLLAITNYEGVDPEVNTDGPERYIDKRYYPKSRGLTLGLNVSF